MRARALLTISTAALVLSIGLVGPVAGAGDIDVRAEVVGEDLEGVPTAVADDGSPVVDDPADDPLHAARTEQLREELETDDPMLLGADGGVRSEPTPTPITFSMVGFSVPQGVGVSFRSRDDGGEWSEWQAAHVHPDEAPDPDDPVEGEDALEDGDDRLPSMPAWVGSADEIQLRVDGGAPEDVGVHLIDSMGQNRDLGDRLSDSVRALAASVTEGRPAAAAVGQPRIVSRSQWGADESWRRGSARYADRAEAAVLHHTAGGNHNSYSESEAPGVVRGIYHYHTQSLGWADIGYNFLVDRFGNLYEGRAGGIEAPVVGAHAAGHNTGTIGVAFMGHHDRASLPGAAESAAVDLVTWLFDVHHIDAEAATTLPSGRSISAGANRIVGHGDLGSTSCPGSFVRERMGAIRSSVVAGQQSMFTDPEVSDERITNGEPFDVSAGLKPSGSWRFTVTDEGGSTVHQQSGSGGSASASWQPPNGTSGAFEWTLSGGDRRPVRGEVGVFDEAAPRVEGSGPIGGSIELSKLAFPETSSARHAVLSRSDVFADAMAGGPLAGTDGPLLLTDSDSLDRRVRDELRRVLPTGSTVYLLGGEEALRDSVADAVRSAGYTVERLAGRERTHTAGLIADEVLARSGANRVMVARSAPDGVQPWADALAGAAWGARAGVPVLLTPTDQLTWKPEDVLEGVDRAIVLGGTAAISSSVERDIAALAGTQRISGGDRASTAVAIAEGLWGRSAGSDGDAFVFGAGWNAGAWQRTLAAAPLAARESAPLLLTASADVSPPTRSYLDRLSYNNGMRARGWVLEDEPIIETPTWTELNLLLQ